MKYAWEVIVIIIKKLEILCASNIRFTNRFNVNNKKNRRSKKKTVNAWVFYG